MSQKRLIVVGGGPGGYVAAIRAASLGMQVTLIEADQIGGTCLNRGCIPSKIMKHTADLYEDLQRSETVGIMKDGGFSVRLDELAGRRKSIIYNQAQGIQTLLRRKKIRYVSGRGTLQAPGEIRVACPDKKTESLSWDKLILATGAVPKELPACPFDGKRVFSSDDIFDIPHIPKALTILGGGVIGCEFAFIFSALGSRVTVVEAADRLLPLPFLDASCAALLVREMKKRKITVLTGSSINACRPVGDGLQLAIGPAVPGKPARDAGKEQTGDAIESDALLVCIGREPDHRSVGLEAIGVATDARGWITVDDHLRTNLPNVFAVGDVLGPGKIMLAHVAYREGVVAAENAAGLDPKMDYSAIPCAIYTRPEIACVGLTEKEAKNRCPDAEVHTTLFRHIGKAHVIREIAGMAAMVVDRRTDRILGVHMVGPHATELIAEATLAIQNRLTAADLAKTIYAHPTLSEVLGETALKAEGRPIHG